jgi:hypothetical protein
MINKNKSCLISMRIPLTESQEMLEGKKIIFTRCTAKLLNKSNVMVLSCYFKIKVEVREIGGSFNWKRKVAYLLIWTNIEV